MSAVASAGTLQAVLGAGHELEDRYAADVWHAGQLGVSAARGRDSVSFTGIQPAWLRQAAKRWARQRVATGHAFNTIRAGAVSFKRFSNFLDEGAPPAGQPQQIDRPLLERYLAWLAAQPLAESTKALSRVFLRAFLEENRRHGWAPGISNTAVIYPDELSSRRHSLPRFIAEFVMGQLENTDNLAQLKARYQNLVVLITETGLRATDACTLPFDPLLVDSAGWPCLRFTAAKMRAEHLLPLSARAAEAIRTQQHDVDQTHPNRSAWLFPSRFAPDLPVPYDTLRRAFTIWQQHIGLHDEAGHAVHVTIHQRTCCDTPPRCDYCTPASIPA